MSSCDVLPLFSLFISIPFVFSVSCFILYTLCPGMWFQLLGCSLPVVVIVFPSSSCVSPVANYPCLPCASIYPSVFPFVFVGSYWFLLVPILVLTLCLRGVFWFTLSCQHPRTDPRVPRAFLYLPWLSTCPPLSVCFVCVLQKTRFTLNPFCLYTSASWVHLSLPKPDTSVPITKPVFHVPERREENCSWLGVFKV